jgi:hypothetical protein
MLPHVIQIGDINAEDVQLANDLYLQLMRLPDTYTCHDVCARLIRQCPVGWVHHRGHFVVRGYEHSWLHHEDKRLILDLYPIAVASGPILLSLQGLSPWKHIYIGDDL